jgi:cohesin loading factor subunit SCC2
MTKKQSINKRKISNKYLLYSDPIVQHDQQQIEKIRINLHKLQSEDFGKISPSKQRSIKPNIPPQQLNHLPADFTPDLIKELLQDGYSLDNNSGERSLRQRRSANSNTTSPKKKRIRSLSTEDDEDDNDDDDDTNDIDNDNNDEHQPLKKRIRRTNDNSLNNNSIDVMSALNKKTRDRLARKALDIDADPQENTSYQRFIQLLDIFNDDYERHHEQLEQTLDDHYLDLLLSDHTLDEMAILSEKLKLSTYMSRIDRMKLKRLLEILSLRIKQGIEMSPILKHDINDEQNDEEEERIWRDLVFERLTMCANACEISLNIMTTDNMPKEILIEHVIEHTSLFIKAQLAKTIFPEYDPLYRNDNHSKDPLLTKQKRSKVTGTKCKQVQILYNKIVSLFQGITDLMPLGKYPDTIILAISSFTVSCIYVENIVDIQAHSLRILTELFSRYEHHRDSILEDLLLSIARLPTSKKSLRCYRLPSGESIQMFTALIMHLIHAPVSLTSTIINANIVDTTNEVHLLNTYTTAQNLAFKFLTLFFRSCGTKQGEDDYRIVFENFLADLLITANRPEWPASEILLTLLSRILMTNFSNHSLPINTRLQSLDYLGSVAAQLRKDTIDNDVLNSQENQDKLEQIVQRVKIPKNKIDFFLFLFFIDFIKY